jgi:hypothetical protein
MVMMALPSEEFVELVPDAGFIGESRFTIAFAV